jgi:hypothetical protein
MECEMKLNRDAEILLQKKQSLLNVKIGGRYTVVEVIFRSDFGEVYKAKDSMNKG